MRVAWVKLRGLILIGTLAVAFAAAADDELERSRATWADNAPEHYVYSYQKFCECHRDVPPQTFVEVDAGRVVRVHHIHANSERQVPAREGSLDLYWTIDDLFALIDTASERGVDYRATYDAASGYPTRVFIDHDPAAVGEEIDVRLTSFEPLD